jgi:hypothetical protein
LPQAVGGVISVLRPVSDALTPANQGIVFFNIVVMNFAAEAPAARLEYLGISLDIKPADVARVHISGAVPALSHIACDLRNCSSTFYVVSHGSLQAPDEEQFEDSSVCGRL